MTPERPSIPPRHSIPATPEEWREAGKAAALKALNAWHDHLYGEWQGPMPREDFDTLTDRRNVLDAINGLITDLVNLHADHVSDAGSLRPPAGTQDEEN